jgi:hypothetical protein
MKKAMRFTWKVARKALMSTVLLVFLGLCLVGFLVGREQVPHPVPVPMDQLFDNLQVYSYRDSPADTSYHYVVELTAFGKPFAEYDVDQRRFVTSGFGRRYDRAFSGAHYGRLKLRGHSGEGCWISVPDSGSNALTKGQFDELTRRTLDYVRPVGVVTNVLGMLSGYSIGYRLGLWETSLANPSVQQRVLDTPGLARTITLEAWRRVLMEPAFMSSQPDAGTFASSLEKQRLYSRFFLLALEDTSGFVEQEANRLLEAGQPQYARAMLEFGRSARRARADSSQLESRDFRAIETWAGFLFSRGHWANYVADTTPDARFRYLGALAHYDLAPPQGPRPGGRHVHQVWVGPRALVNAEGDDGYIPDEIPATMTGCPTGWRAWLEPGPEEGLRNLYAVRWVHPPGEELIQVAQALRRTTLRIAALMKGGRRTAPDASVADAPGFRLARPSAHRGDASAADSAARAHAADSAATALPDPVLNVLRNDSSRVARDSLASASADSTR